MDGVKLSTQGEGVGNRIEERARMFNNRQMHTVGIRGHLSEGSGGGMHCYSLCVFECV